MKKPPAIKPAPNTPTQASFVSNGAPSSASSSAARPNKLINPVIGFSLASAGRPSLLGGM